MATPNLTNITSIIPGQINVGLETGLVGIVTNSNASNSTLKIDNIKVTNTSSTILADVSVGLSVVGSATTSYILQGTTIPANAALIIADRESGIYLLENTRLVAFASTVGQLQLSVKYETIS